MKTSVTQYKLMIRYMEQHGDISQPVTDAKCRLRSLKLWQELCNLLNRSGSGDTKTIGQWKKIWSDCKHNTKKKAARLHKAANGTGDGPAVFAKLSDFEHRVLKIMGVQVAAGLALEEAGLVQDTEIQPRSRLLENPIQLPIEIVPMLPGPPQILPTQIEDTYSSQGLLPGPSKRAHVTPTLRLENSFQEIDTQHKPALSGQTISQAARPARSRRRIKSAHIERAAQHFLQTQKSWTKLKQAQHRDYMEIRWGRVRIRELELQTQRELQKIALRGLDILDKIAVKNCRE